MALRSSIQRAWEDVEEAKRVELEGSGCVYEFGPQEICELAHEICELPQEIPEIQGIGHGEDKMSLRRIGRT